jgi:3-hydroxyacyl-CoA dehydrogenase
MEAFATRNRLTFTSNMQEALSEADFVQENGPECPEFKIKLFAEMDEATTIHKVNEAYERVVNSDVRYRFVIDMKSLKSKD